MKKSVVIHPFLFAIYPVLFIFSYNIEQASFHETFLPAGIALGFTLLLLSLSGIILKDIKKAGIIVSAFLVFFFSYGHVQNMMNFGAIGGFVISRNRYLLLTWGLLIACSVYFAVRTRRDLNNFTKILNTAALSLVVISLINIAIYEFRKSDSFQNSNNNKTSKDSQNSNINSGKLTLNHDIYYIILDGYANSSTLKEVFNYDNSEFTDYLTEKGFYLSTKSRSNYAHTILSLSSSLNMEYINYISDIVGKESKDYSMLSQMIQNSKVVNFLKSKGYKFINISSGWGPTGYNKQADLNFYCGRISEFYMILLQTTMLSPFEEYLIKDDLRNRILCIFSKLAEMHKIKGQKFIFAHIISPHPPFVFGPNGENVPAAKLKMTGYVWKQKENYINQLIFINKKVKMLVDEILSKSEIPPIIILQADHGPASTLDWGSLPVWENPTIVMLKEKTRILNAYYLPSGGNNLLYDSITPVNTFRLIFNFYFNANYKLLNDEVYFSSLNHPYNFINVTKKVKYE